MKKKIDKIYVIGLGFVGLTTALSFASKNFKVIGYDINSKVIDNLKKGKISFNEPLLKKELKKSIKNKKISFTNNMKFSKKENYIIFICVGTPLNKKFKYDLVSLIKCIKMIQKNIHSRCYIFIKSTVLPGTTDYLMKNIIKNKRIKIASNPEFLREGKAWEDFNNADKIVIGHSDDVFKEITFQLYKKFRGQKIFVNPSTAEFIKQISNSMLSNMISFSNNFAILAEKFKDIDIKSAFNAIRLDKRFYGQPSNIVSYIYPGLGFGGYCLPKDIKAIHNFSKKFKQDKFFSNIINVNKDIFNLHLKKILSKTKKNYKICILGLSFKEGTDDIRDSRSIKLVNHLLKKKYSNLTLCDNLATNELNNYYKYKKIKIISKPIFQKKMIYILCNTDKSFLDFLRKIPAKQIIDTRYLL